MTTCLSWLLDARLHVSLVVSAFALAVAGDQGESTAPATPTSVDCHFNQSVVVAYPDGTPPWGADRFGEGLQAERSLDLSSR